MAKIKDGLQYTRDHEWARQEGGVIRMGITDFAQHELGDIVFVDLPATGARVTAGKSMGSLEAVKTVAEIFAPFSGVVASVNEKLKDDAALINRDCYGEGWLVMITPEIGGDPDGLLTADEYRKLTGE